ncbi:MAG TPA: hypothetical protein VK629_20990 [Steroidobacteraceae bacterium]|nr:hypothetical protein [Steroidobacteraceae bacterium]
MKGIQFLLVCIGSMLCSFAIAAQPAAAASDAQTLANKIQGEVAEIRGLKFKRSIKASKQTPEEFGRYLDGQIKEGVPEAVSQHYGKIVQKLGLYRGPEIKDFASTMKSVMTSQAGAYYDPKTKTFYVLLEGLPEVMLGMFFAHELHHGLQDQYFDLEKYMGMNQVKQTLDSDQRMARQAVVEGEATYIMNLWGIKSMTQGMPPRELMAPIVRMQSQMDMAQMQQMMQSPQMEELGGDIKKSIDATAEIPAFILESLLGAYLKGMNFVFDVEAGGWSAVDKLYRDAPPESTEQILHPEKWSAGEKPVAIEWPAFSIPELKNWEVLDNDALGELLWRVVFKEHGIDATSANDAAAGWNGDRYAVLKDKTSNALLLLWRTSWDSAADAKEFADAYRKVLSIKYEGKKEATRLVQSGTTVSIVEGGSEATIDALLKFVDRAQERKR